MGWAPAPRGSRFPVGARGRERTRAPRTVTRACSDIRKPLPCTKVKILGKKILRPSD
jgi:hypothetical protein